MIHALRKLYLPELAAVKTRDFPLDAYNTIRVNSLGIHRLCLQAQLFCTSTTVEKAIPESMPNWWHHRRHVERYLDRMRPFPQATTVRQLYMRRHRRLESSSAGSSSEGGRGGPAEGGGGPRGRGLNLNVWTDSPRNFHFACPFGVSINGQVVMRTMYVPMGKHLLLSAEQVS